MQMLSAGHIEETEMLQDSEQQTRAPLTSLQAPERVLTVDAQLSPPIFRGAGAEATPAARQPRRCKSCVRACCRIVSSKRGRGGSCCAGRWSTPWRSTLGSWRSKHGPGLSRTLLSSAADRGLSSAGDVLGGSGWTLSPGWRPLALSTACAPASRSSEHARAGNAFRWTTSKHGQPSAVLSSGLIGAGSEAN
jgi:hypothetical protein